MKLGTYSLTHLMNKMIDTTRMLDIIVVSMNHHLVSHQPCQHDWKDVNHGKEVDVHHIYLAMKLGKQLIKCIYILEGMSYIIGNKIHFTSQALNQVLVSRCFGLKKHIVESTFILHMPSHGEHKFLNAPHQVCP